MIQPETIAGRKEYFRKKREAFVATWTTDPNGVVHILLGNGFEALFSAHWKPLVSNFSWHLKFHIRNVCKFYAEAYVIEELIPQYGRYTSLHRVILGVPKGIQVDHENSNGLDCRDDNIRVATSSQNASNRHYLNSNGYRGVVRRGKKFGSQIEYNGENHNLGTFLTAAEAGHAYDQEALRIFGEFAILNQI